VVKARARVTPSAFLRLAAARCTLFVPSAPHRRRPTPPRRAAADLAPCRLQHPTQASRAAAVAQERANLPTCRLWLTETLPCLLKVEQASPGLLTSQRAYKSHYRGDQVEAAGCACALPDYHQLVAQAKAAGVWHGYEWSSYAVNPA
jgi:hypothetical protein